MQELKDFGVVIVIVIVIIIINIIIIIIIIILSISPIIQCYVIFHSFCCI